MGLKKSIFRQTATTQQQDVGCLSRQLRRIRHGDADVGAGQGRPIIDAVADHGDDATLRLQPANQVDFLIGEDVAVDFREPERRRPLGDARLVAR